MCRFVSRPGIRFLVTVLALVALAHQARAADDGRRGFVEKVFKDEGGNHKYVVFVPKNYAPSRPSPVILFLHGAGERGSDGKIHLNVGLGPLVKAREATFPALVVFPQSENTRSRVLEGWQPDTPDAQRALRILEQVEKDYRVDTKHRILTGWSMGGFGAWSIAAADPSKWSCLAVLAGGGRPEWAEKLKDLPIWAFHGEADTAVRVNRSREMIDALKAAGATPRYTEFRDGDHDSWKTAYADDRLIAWMLDPQKVDPDKLPAPRTLVTPQPVIEEPFVPALELSRAVYVRLGNQALDAAAYAAPKRVPADLLSGRINDLGDYTNVDGYGFNIQFSGISYTSQLNQVRIKALGKDRLSIQVALSKVALNIGATYVTGQDHSAQAGPIQVGMGHVRPVWLSVDVQPYIEKRRLRLKLLGSRFDIPDDNWYVTSPAGVSVQGFGMKRDRVSSGLVNGLYGSKHRIENEVLAVVPKLIDTFEKKLAEFGDMANSTGSIWPLPVYRPRVKLWPQEISTDENGVTLALGMTAAAVDAKNTPKQPKVVELNAPLPAELTKLKTLQVGIAPQALQPLTELLVQADVARIHVLDIPEGTFVKFGDKAALSEAIPELKRYADAELWPELTLVSGINATDASEKAGPTHLQFHVPKLLITTSLKSAAADDSKKSEATLTPLTVFEIELKQKTQAEFVKPDSQSRAVKLVWDGDPEIKVSCRFADGYQPQDNTIRSELVEQWLKESWQAWTSLGPVTSIRIPDADFGLTKLRMSNAGWESPHLFATFTPAGVKVTNSSKEIFIYETKGPYSDWSTTRYTLEPGKSHEFEIAYPLTYRRNNEIYTLYPGSHSEFREPLTGGPPRFFRARE